MSATDMYEGRLEADGNGNLLASDRTFTGYRIMTLRDSDGKVVLDGVVLDDNNDPIEVSVPQYKLGPLHGFPVVAVIDPEKPDAATYRLASPGEKSHNALYHKNVVEAVPTQDKDPEQPGYAGPDAKNATEGNEHHFDAHYTAMRKAEGGADMGTLFNTMPDTVAKKATGHTDAYKDR